MMNISGLLKSIENEKLMPKLQDFAPPSLEVLGCALIN